MSYVTIYANDPLHRRVAKRAYAASQGVDLKEVRGTPKEAGEIRFVKDQGPEERSIPTDFEFKAKYVKPLTSVMWSLSCSMGHLVSAQSTFTKIKAVRVSPDGKLGGKGYIQKISDIRTNLAAALETISNTVDTLHDEVSGAHWKPVIKDLSKKDQKEISEMVSDSEDILDDPEAYDEQTYKDEILDDLKE